MTMQSLCGANNNATNARRCATQHTFFISYQSSLYSSTNHYFYLFMEDYLNDFSAIISVTFSAKSPDTLPNLPFLLHIWYDIQHFFKRLFRQSLHFSKRLFLLNTTFCNGHYFKKLSMYPYSIYY